MAPDSSGAAGPAGEAGPAGGATADALRRLEARLDRASRAAESLIEEVTGAARGSGGAEGGGAEAGPPETGGPQAGGAEAEAGGAPGRSSTPPPAGWQIPGSGAAAPGASADTEILLRALGALRDLIPPELQRRIAEALRELLLAVRALIDWYLERVQRRSPAPARVRDIPIA